LKHVLLAIVAVDGPVGSIGAVGVLVVDKVDPGTSALIISSEGASVPVGGHDIGHIHIGRGVVSPGVSQTKEVRDITAVVDCLVISNPLLRISPNLPPW
jgi:hypothetical protein